MDLNLDFNNPDIVKMFKDDAYIFHTDKNGLQKKYNPIFGDDRKCICGHRYYRHFDSWDEMATVGCKYCGCDHFIEMPTKCELCETPLEEGKFVDLSPYFLCESCADEKIKETEPVPEYGDLMILERWIECVKSGGFIDCDGEGYYSDGKLMYRYPMVKPSHFFKGKVDTKRTHIVWINR